MRSVGLRVLFAGGGTGGHLMPGAAMAEALGLAAPGSRCLFLVAARAARQRWGSAIARFNRVEMPDAPWDGPGQKLRFPVRSGRAAARAIGVLRAFRPHVVVGLGGSSCVAPTLVGRLMGARTALVEANAVPGRTVRMLAPLVDAVAVQWAATGRGLRARRVISKGLPVRLRLLRGRRERALKRLGFSPDRVTLLVMGGSQGAEALNRALVASLPMLAQGRPPLQVVHLTGEAHLAEALRARRRSPLPYRPIGFADEMADLYAAADLVLARAGGSTLAELTALGLPAILVPYPHATDDHQMANAAALSSAGAAVTVEQWRLSPERLAEEVLSLVSAPERLGRLAARARSLGRPMAAAEVAGELAAMAGFEAGRPGGDAVPRVISERSLKAA